MTQPKYIGSKNGTWPIFETFIVSASGSDIIISKGDVMEPDSTDGTAKLGSAATTIILGFANEDVTIPDGSSAEVSINVNPWSVYEMDTADADPSIGGEYDLKDEYRLDGDGTTNKVLRVLTVDAVNDKCTVIPAKHFYK